MKLPVSLDAIRHQRALIARLDKVVALKDLSVVERAAMRYRIADETKVA